jgi:hypothetical protein
MNQQKWSQQKIHRRERRKIIARFVGEKKNLFFKLKF